MNLLIVSATTFEVLPLLDYLRSVYKNKEDIRFFDNQLDIRILVTGVGAVHTTFHLATFLSKVPTDLAINLGIAGAFNPALNIGDVVQVVQDQWADIGVEEANGDFTDIFDMELQAKNEKPYQAGSLVNDSANDFLRKVTAITVNKVHGAASSIAKIEKKYSADIESMEGAAFFYTCQMNQINCLQIRSISNYVEPRDKDNWDIPLAINNLNETAIALIQSLRER